MKYSAEDLQMGMRTRSQAQAQPENFGTIDGATESQGINSQPKSRMAGKVGERVNDLMNNPDEIARTKQWMSMFGLSNQGAEFNQARMMMANPQQQVEDQT